MNEREAITREALDGLGWLSMKSGWPDFLVEDEARRFIFCIEVKSETDDLNPDQQIVQKILDRANIPVIVVTVWKGSSEIELMKDIKRMVDAAYEEMGKNWG